MFQPITGMKTMAWIVDFLNNQISNIFRLLPIPTASEFLFRPSAVIAIVLGAYISIKFLSRKKKLFLAGFMVCILLTGSGLSYVDYFYLVHYRSQTDCPEADYATHTSVLPVSCRGEFCAKLEKGSADNEMENCRDIDQLGDSYARIGVMETTIILWILEFLFLLSFSVAIVSGLKIVHTKNSKRVVSNP